MATFPERASQIVATTARIAKLQGESLETIVLEQAHADIVETGYDNWNGGITLYTLILEIPIPIYAKISDQCKKLESTIQERVAQVIRAENEKRITEVVISPILAEESRPGEPSHSSDIQIYDIPTFWEPGYFRLFITHVSTHKDKAHELKKYLAQFQIAAFVAHDDIAPTREWQNEIERALRTMDALLAMISTDFLTSRWCDQEVGIAIGREKLVIPLRFGADPHGFLGKFQGLPTNNLNFEILANQIVDILIKNPQSSLRMTDALVERLASSVSWETAKNAMTLIEKIPRLNETQSTRLVGAISSNNQVGDAFGVPDRIRTLVANNRVKLKSS